MGIEPVRRNNVQSSCCDKSNLKLQTIAFVIGLVGYLIGHGRSFPSLMMMGCGFGINGISLIVCTVRAFVSTVRAYVNRKKAPPPPPPYQPPADQVEGAPKKTPPQPYQAPVEGLTDGPPPYEEVEGAPPPYDEA